MKPIVKALKEAKISSFKEIRDESFPVSNGGERSHESLVRILQSALKPALLGEIHQLAQYNGTGFEVPLQELASLYDQYCDAIVIATDDLIFSGKIEWIQELRRFTKKPIVVLDLFLERKQIKEVNLLGADVVILLACLLNPEELSSLRHAARDEGLEVIIEVQNEVDLKTALDLKPDIVGINTRDIENLARVDMSRLNQLAPLVHPEIPVIAESGITTAYDIEKLKGFCRGVLIGSAILGSRSIEGSLKYFKEQNIDYPFIWVRPSAFLYRRMNWLLEKLERKGFSIVHSFPINNTPDVYHALYLSKLKKYPKEGVVYFTLMAESLKQIGQRGGNPNYSEVWFLQHSHFSLIEAYETLGSIKREIRVQEEIPVTTVRIQNRIWPVLLHSVHVPNPTYFDHRKELAIFSQFRDYNIGIEEYIEQKLYLDDVSDATEGEKS